MRTSLAFVAALTAATGCATDDTDGSGSGLGSVPRVPTASGTYHLRSDISLTAEALLPEPAADLVATLRDFSANPSHTLINLAGEAGVPAVQELHDALPAVVEDKLEGWMNDEIAKLKIGGVPVTTASGWIVGWAEATLTQFALTSELTIANGTATHTLTSLDFYPAGVNIAFPLNDITSNVLVQPATCSQTASSLSLGDHTFGLAYGEYMWRAFEAAFTAEFGMDIRGSLAAAVNCPALAQVIATKCVSSYCVGHAAQLTAICEAGIDESVDRAYAKVAALRFDAVHFAAGSATFVDADGDYDVEAMTAGVWNAEINVGLGLRHVPATFTATR